MKKIKLIAPLNNGGMIKITDVMPKQYVMKRRSGGIQLLMHVIIKQYAMKLSGIPTQTNAMHG